MSVSQSISNIDKFLSYYFLPHKSYVLGKESNRFQCFCINFLKDNYLFLNLLLLCIINMQFLHFRIIYLQICCLCIINMQIIIH